VEKQMRAAEDGGRVTLRIVPDELDPLAEPELGNERLDRRDETAGYEEASVWVAGQESGERLERKLETVRLRLVATQKEHGATGGSALRWREVADVHGVRQHLPRSAWLAEEAIGRPLRKLALVEDVIGSEKRSAKRAVGRLGAITRPTRISDAVLVHDDGNMATPREEEQRAEIAREPSGAEVEEREVARAIREALVQLLRLGSAACCPLA